MTEEILSAISGEVFGVWFLIGAALVFWMQAGFAMVEVGFTRAKNAGNILMKNLMDFCIGCVVFIAIGFGLFLGEDALFGLVGIPNLAIFTDYANFDWSNFVFNLVFCATTATIVSGSMAERTKFLSYCIYSAVISAVIYPIEAHWVWGGGWLAQMGFHDFAGSNCIHMVGGIAAFIGAWMLGPRIGKFKKDAQGKIVGVNAFPGHNLPLGCLGVFILWLGWYGFNGAAAVTIPEMGSVFVTTTIAPSVATFVCMVYTWLKYGKPDVSMCLNASLAGLVAVTAPCDVCDAAGAAAIGAVSGVLVVFGVWFMDYKLHIDDPVGACAVHLLNGIWGTIAVGLFATDTAPAFERAVNGGANQILSKGLFYGGGFTQLGIQLLGMFCTIAWTAVTIYITFAVIRKTIGLRASAEEEIEGLDRTEHGLVSAYADFAFTSPMFEGHQDVVLTGSTPLDEAVPVLVKSAPKTEPGRYTKITIICNNSKFEQLKANMAQIGVTGMTVTQVMGCGVQKGRTEYYRGVPLNMNLLPKLQVDIVVSTVSPSAVVAAAKNALYTGHPGDGKIFLYDVEDVVRVRTGETGVAALADTAV